MRKIPVNMQKVFNFAKANERTSIYQISIYQIAKSLDLDYKNIHSAVKRCEELGLLCSEMDYSVKRPVRLVFVRPEIVDLRIEAVFLESGSRMLEHKKSRRKAYFERNGSMSLPAGEQTRHQEQAPKSSQFTNKPVVSSVRAEFAAENLSSVSLRRKAFVS